MLKRLVVGLVLGALIGAALAAGVVFGLGMTTFGGGMLVTFPTIVAYAAAAITGLLTGLVAGKPIWSEGGKVEAALKAFFGALLGAAGMWAARRFVHFDVDLSSVGAGAGAASSLPVLVLPALGMVLGGFFELDNTGGEEPEAKSGKVRAPAARVRVDGRAHEEDEDEAAAPVSRKQRR